MGEVATRRPLISKTDLAPSAPKAPHLHIGTTMLSSTTGHALSIAEAAYEAGVNKATLYRAIRAGRGPIARKIGNRTIILRNDLQRWIDALPTLRMR